MAVLSEHADPVSKVTILPAGRALGVTEQLPLDERHLYPESYLRDSLAIRLGGRASELLVLGEASTRCGERSSAERLSWRSIWCATGGFLPASGRSATASKDRPTSEGPSCESRPYSEGTQLAIDEEVSRLLSEAEERAGRFVPEPGRGRRRCSTPVGARNDER